MFLAHIGLQTAEGIGLVVADIATAVTLGGCKPENRNPAYYCEPGFGPPTHGCVGNTTLTSPLPRVRACARRPRGCTRRARAPSRTETLF